MASVQVADARLWSMLLVRRRSVGSEPFTPDVPISDRGVMSVLFTALMMVVPMAMYHLLEAPMIRLGNRLSLRSPIANGVVPRSHEAPSGVSS